MKLSSLLLILLFPLLVIASKDPTKYPLKVHILRQNWASHNVRRSDYRASGWGNIWEGDSVHGFDFDYECSFGLRRTAHNQPYMAKWKKPRLRLTVLAGEIGKNNKYQECQLKTTMHEGVYILQAGGGISELSQDDYKAWKAKQDAVPTKRQADLSRVSVASTPDSAEIEIDGEFMGNTPSTLEIGPGEHDISVRKAGYKAWEKKINLAPGDIKVDAELEPDGSR